jgi:hypothetical protein
MFFSSYLVGLMWPCFCGVFFPLCICIDVLPFLSDLLCRLQVLYYISGSIVEFTIY